MSTKLLLLFSFFLLLASCGKDDDSQPKPDPDPDPDPPVVVDFFELSMATINFSENEDASLVVVKTNDNWRASCNEQWISLSASEGTKSTGFIVGASANKKFSREATITISSDDKTKEIRVLQSGVSSIQFELNGVQFSLLPVEADTTISLDGSTYLAQRKVFLDSYFISETEITNAQWHAVMGSLPYEMEDSKPNLPVVVNWNDISEKFLPKLRDAIDYNFRLPTENEWEVAARGGKKDQNTSYAGGIEIDEVAWHWGNSEGRKHKVALKAPNELGLYDMSGNVSEWCSDWYAQWTENNKPPAEANNPTGPENGTEKVIRGGDFSADRFEYDRNSCRVTTRNYLPPDINTSDFLFDGYYHHTGFRLVIPKN
ncbi:SUMF1/EgtB/PvdO family nonheme iron enzyme [Marinilabilia sp.]